jgi:hypothetical protein
MRIIGNSFSSLEKLGFYVSLAATMLESVDFCKDRISSPCPLMRAKLVSSL